MQDGQVRPRHVSLIQGTMHSYLVTHGAVKNGHIHTYNNLRVGQGQTKNAGDVAQ